MPDSPHTETVLLADNDPIIRNLIARMLDHQGYNVLEAAGGEEALALAAQYPDPIHLLLTDARMPGIDGFGLADRLILPRPVMKVLYISGHYDDISGVRQGLHRYQRPFLLKPFHHDDLARTIREVLDRPTDRECDAFAFILTSPIAAAEPLEDSPPPQGIPRALRFRARLPLRYRTAREFEWHDGVTENISRSGLLFQSSSPLAPKMSVDIFLPVPGGEDEESTRRLRCHGDIVRVLAPVSPEILPSVAAAVDEYVLAAS